ncbi:MAG: hypothetical protein LBI27_04065 [Clostridiales bacterium]|jgi:hypothetical protein|nr:hypothetical protein [Clostridiales bacterium]
MLVLYELQNILHDIDAGAFFGDSFLIPCSDTSNLFVSETEDVKSIFVSERASDSDGLAILTPDFGKYVPGDRVTITGRVSENIPIGGWCFELHKCHPNGSSRLIQRYFPKRDKMYVLSYILDTRDEERHIRLITYPYVQNIKPADFYIDNILITRSMGENALTDTRGIIYSMENDPFLTELNGGGYTEYLFASGNPKYSVNEGGELGIKVSRRVNDWDGIDVRTHLMNLLRGNKYCVRVKGRIDGNAPANAEMILQILPSYSWCEVQRVSSFQYFTLEHVFSSDELDTLESVRITTNAAGTKMSFFVHEIKLFVLE